MDNTQNEDLQLNIAQHLKISGFLQQLNRELRIPMDTIVGCAESISRESVSDEVRDNINNIKQATDRMMILTENMIDVVKISNGEIEIGEEEYSFEDISLDIRRRIEKQTESKGIGYEVEIDDNIPYRLLGDESKLKRMLDRLVNNAIEVTNEGKVRFAVKCLPGQKGKIFLRVDISDNGSGELSDSIVKVLGGSGAVADDIADLDNMVIGVFLTKYFSAQMGGRLTVKSRKGEGCTYTLLVSQRAVGMITAAEYLAEEDNIGRGSFTASGARILIVSTDTEMGRKLFRKLNKYSITADLTDDAEAAAELIKRIKYDIVFTDYKMPDIEENNMTVLIRNLAENSDSHTAKLPIIILGREGKEYILKDGYSRVLHNFEDEDELVTAIRESIDISLIEFSSEYSYDGKGLEVLDALGLNTKLALSNFSGDEQEYREVLLTLCRSSDTKSKMLNYYLEQHDYKNYIVAIHGILGVAQVIGAEAVATKARELEKAAKQGARELIEKETQKFGDDFEKLLSAVRNVIMDKNRDTRKGAIEKKDLVSILDELIVYLNDYQITEVEELFFKLAQFSYPDERVMELIHKAEECMLNYNYSDVIATLNTIKTLLRGEDD